eukprot:sb/3460953/
MVLKPWLCTLYVLTTLFYNSDSISVPKFGKQFQNRYELTDLGKDVCVLTPQSVVEQLNCVDCLKNISSTLLTSDGQTLYIGARDTPAGCSHSHSSFLYLSISLSLYLSLSFSLSLSLSLSLYLSISLSLYLSISLSLYLSISLSLYLSISLSLYLSISLSLYLSISLSLYLSISLSLYLSISLSLYLSISLSLYLSISLSLYLSISLSLYLSISLSLYLSISLSLYLSISLSLYLSISLSLYLSISLSLYLSISLSLYLSISLSLYLSISLSLYLSISLSLYLSISLSLYLSISLSLYLSISLSLYLSISLSLYLSISLSLYLSISLSLYLSISLSLYLSISLSLYLSISLSLYLSISLSLYLSISLSLYLSISLSLYLSISLSLYLSISLSLYLSISLSLYLSISLSLYLSISLSLYLSISLSLYLSISLSLYLSISLSLYLSISLSLYLSISLSLYLSISLSLYLSISLSLYLSISLSLYLSISLSLYLSISLSLYLSISLSLYLSISLSLYLSISLSLYLSISLSLYLSISLSLYLSISLSLYLSISLSLYLSISLSLYLSISLSLYLSISLSLYLSISLSLYLSISLSLYLSISLSLYLSISLSLYLSISLSLYLSISLSLYLSISLSLYLSISLSLYLSISLSLYLSISLSLYLSISLSLYLSISLSLYLSISLSLYLSISLSLYLSISLSLYLSISLSLYLSISLSLYLSISLSLYLSISLSLYLSISLSLSLSLSFSLSLSLSACALSLSISNCIYNIFDTRQKFIGLETTDCRFTPSPLLFLSLPSPTLPSTQSPHHRFSPQLTWSENIITQVLPLAQGSLLACGSNSVSQPEAIILKPGKWNTTVTTRVVNLLLCSCCGFCCVHVTTPKTHLTLIVSLPSYSPPPYRQLWWFREDVFFAADVCSYSLADIDASFAGNYYVFDSDGARVEESPRYPFDNRVLIAASPESLARFPVSQCKAFTGLNQCIVERDPHCCWCMTSHSCGNVNDCDAAQCVNDPIEGKFTSILTDNIGQMTVIYLGTDSGSVEKLSLTPKTNKVVLISEFVVADTHSPVTMLKFTNSENRVLIAASPESLARFPVSQCKAFTGLNQCIVERDPHCCWCMTSHSCGNVNDCDAAQCVNDPIEGKLSNVFTRISTYKWVNKGECEPTCDESAEKCSKGLTTIKTFDVYPSIKEIKRETRNCTYTGTWKPRQSEPVSQNVTISDKGANEARYSGSSESKLFKILALVFGSLFVISICLIVFLMIYTRRSSSRRDNTGGSNSSLKKRNIDRKKSTLETMGPGSTNTTSTLIMPEGLDRVASNSPYRSHMTTEDERLLQMTIPQRDPTENMYSDVFNGNNAQTLPRNFGGMGLPGQQQLPQQHQQQHPYTMTLQRQNPNNRPFPGTPFIPGDYLRHHNEQDTAMK